MEDYNYFINLDKDLKLEVIRLCCKTFNYCICCPVRPIYNNCYYGYFEYFDDNNLNIYLSLFIDDDLTRNIISEFLCIKKGVVL